MPAKSKTAKKPAEPQVDLVALVDFEHPDVCILVANAIRNNKLTREDAQWLIEETKKRRIEQASRPITQEQFVKAIDTFPNDYPDQRNLRQSLRSLLRKPQSNKALQEASHRLEINRSCRDNRRDPTEEYNKLLSMLRSRRKKQPTVSPLVEIHNHTLFCKYIAQELAAKRIAQRP